MAGWQEFHGGQCEDIELSGGRTSTARRAPERVYRRLRSVRSTSVASRMALYKFDYYYYYYYDTARTLGAKK